MNNIPLKDIVLIVVVLSAIGFAMSYFSYVPMSGMVVENRSQNGMVVENRSQKDEILSVCKKLMVFLSSSACCLLYFLTGRIGSVLNVDPPNADSLVQSIIITDDEVLVAPYYFLTSNIYILVCFIFIDIGLIYFFSYADNKELSLVSLGRAFHWNSFFSFVGSMFCGFVLLKLHPRISVLSMNLFLVSMNLLIFRIFRKNFYKLYLDRANVALDNMKSLSFKKAGDLAEARGNQSDIGLDPGSQTLGHSTLEDTLRPDQPEQKKESPFQVLGQSLEFSGSEEGEEFPKELGS